MSCTAMSVLVLGIGPSMRHTMRCVPLRKLFQIYKNKASTCSKWTAAKWLKTILHDIIYIVFQFAPDEFFYISRPSQRKKTKSRSCYDKNDTLTTAMVYYLHGFLHGTAQDADYCGQIAAESTGINRLQVQGKTWKISDRN